MKVFCTEGGECDRDIWDNLGRFFDNNSEILAKLPMRIVDLKGLYGAFGAEDARVLKEFGDPKYLEKVFIIDIIIFCCVVLYLVFVWVVLT